MTMFNRLAQFVFPSIPARFESDFTVSESVARLSSATKRNVFSSLTGEFAAGPVSHAQVRLQRVQPFFGNSFKPVFVGRFRDSDGRAVLEGTFTVFGSTRTFMTVWLLFMLFLAAYSVVLGGFVAAADGTWSTFLFLPVSLGFFAVGIAFVKFAWRWSRADMEFISTVIRRALRNGGA